MRETKLLILAGSLNAPRTAVIFGVNAVCIGGEVFGFRVKAHNPPKNDMKEGTAFVRACGVKIYVAVNILAHNRDLPGVGAHSKELKEIGPDVLIISDPDVLAAAKKVLSGMEIHINIWASNTNYGIYLSWHKLGARRVVTARGLSPDEIREIREHTPEDMEIESFIHGAICVSYSRRCLLSGFFVGRNINQGVYTHLCRRKCFIAKETKPGEYMPVYENERGAYILNSKDLRMIDYVPEMMDAGVDNFKIKSRMKMVPYVAIVARTYRKVIDGYKKGPQLYRSHMKWYRQEIGKRIHREFITGPYFGKSTEDAQAYDNNTYVKNYTYLGTVLEVDGRGWCPIQQKNRFCVGDIMEAMESDGHNLELTAAGMGGGEGNVQDSASHPEWVFWIDLRVDTDLEIYDALRKKGESA